MRYVVNANELANSLLMHFGIIKNLGTLIAHYAAGIVNNANLDGKLKPYGRSIQQLNLQAGKSPTIIAFIKSSPVKHVHR